MKDLKDLKGAIGCSLTSPKEDYSKYGVLKDVEHFVVKNVGYCLMFFEHNVIRVRESLLPQIQIIMEDIPVLSEADFALYF